jgi:hypothetical protein
MLSSFSANTNHQIWKLFPSYLKFDASTFRIRRRATFTVFLCYTCYPTCKSHYNLLHCVCQDTRIINYYQICYRSVKNSQSLPKNELLAL